jgi:enoyl-CoA hydratase
MSDVLIRVVNACGRITLDRPRAMNALTLEMIRAMYRALVDWAEDPLVQIVVVDGSGTRGLCAGGDIRALYDAAISGQLELAAEFFREEYRLNALIARYPKPYVALMDGVVMGGGIGISAHGSHRLVTERSALAMPETGIGFVPDVGGTYLLGTAPSEFGTYLALTANRIGAADAILCGLADVFVGSDKLESLLSQLEQCSSAAALEDCLSTFTEPPPQGKLQNEGPWIRECFSKSSVESILAALREYGTAEAANAAAEIASKSPTSLKVTLLALRRAREYNELGACLEQEYAISLACLKSHDFKEGVRAAIIDKDRNPVWRPATLEEVTEEVVDQYFAEYAEHFQLSV